MLPPTQALSLLSECSTVGIDQERVRTRCQAVLDAHADAATG